MICSICMRRIDKHTIQEAQVCSIAWNEQQLERLANKLCLSCGESVVELEDIDGSWWCHSCLAFYTPPI